MPKNVLVVDDSAMMRRIVIEQLRACEFDVNVIEAEDGRQGLERFKLGDIACVLSDWNMPTMDGLTMVREMRKLDPHSRVSIVMITTNGNADNIMHALHAGADQHLAKPLTPAHFKAALTAILG